jgi:16S rRNA processing protein RimM
MPGNNVSNETIVGKITSVYGVKGWVKVTSYTEPKENIFGYSGWILRKDGVDLSVSSVTGKAHGKGLIAYIDGFNDRDKASKLCGAMITVDRDSFPALDAGEYYWYQLEGLEVENMDGKLLGKVDHLIETGSNDVLVVKGCKGSIDSTERLIPYLPGQYVTSVDLAGRKIRVDWDPGF